MCAHALMVSVRGLLIFEIVRTRVGLYERGRNREKIWPAHVDI